MLRRRSSLAVSKESPKDAFIAILRSLSERSDPYFYGLNAFKDDGFGIHRLLDLQWQQMRKIFKMFLYTGKKGDVSHGGMDQLCDDIGREFCQVSTHRLQRKNQADSKSTEKWNQQLFLLNLDEQPKKKEAWS